MRSWFNSILLSSLRTRLVLLVLLAVVPALGLILYTASEQRRSAILETQENTLRLVRLAATNQKQVVDTTRQILTILGQLPVIRQGKSVECDRLLADLLQQYPTYANFAVIDVQGNKICSALYNTDSVNLADRPYFQNVLQTRKFEIGEYQIDRFTKKATVNFAYPILDQKQRVQNVVIAVVDLDQLNKLAAQVKLPPEALLSVVDDQGKLLVRYPEPQNWVGKSLPEAAFYEMKQAQGEGTYESISLDGIPRLFAFTPLGDNPLKPDAYIRVGIPLSTILAQQDRLLVRNLLGLGAVTTLALIAAWVGGDVFLIRQVKLLVQTAEKLGKGELNTRTRLSHKMGEIGQLGRAIDEMAAALETREVAIASLNQDLKTLFELTPISILIAQDPEFKQVKANPAFAQILGISPEINVSYTPVNIQPPAYKVLRDGQELTADEFPLRYAAIHKVEIKGTELDIVRADGTIFNLFGYAAPLLDEQGNARGSVAAFLDISDRKRTEEHTNQLMLQIQNQANVLQAILSASVDHIYIFDLLGRYQYVSDGGAAIMGCKPEDLVGKIWQELSLPLTVAETMNRLDTQRAVVMRTGQPLTAEAEYPTPDGIHYYEYILAPLQTPKQIIAGVIAVSRDITDRQRTDQALRESEQRLRLAQRAAKIGTWEWNVRTGKISWSEGIWDILGLERNIEEPSIKSWTDFIHPDDRQRTLQTVENLFAQGDEYYDEFRIVRNDGAMVWLSSKGRIIRSVDGEVERFLGVNIDISERKQAEQEREQLLLREQRAREAAESANRIKDEFLAVLSHELRTPLNPILGWTKLLRNGKLDDAKKAIALETIERNAKLQTQLIGDLLDISRILQGKLTLNICPVDLAATIEAAKETVRLAAEAKSIQLHTEIVSPVKHFLGDSSRLQQVVWNLLSNAVKFTPPGGQVNIKLESVGSEAQIQVSDSGKGISREFLPYVFETFRQADSATTRQFGGLGLGLAIVRHIVEMHGGTVHADSPGEGQGATFTVKLPLLVATTAQKPQEIPPENTLDFTGVRILVVDDDVDTRDLLSFILQQHGAEVTAAASAAAALAELKHSQPHILLCDIAMPEIDGYTLIREIRTMAIEQGGKIPAIALTAFAGELNQQQALAAGFQKHLAKPVESDELVQAIARLLKK
ncbi:PAS domain S-box protein [Tolypothrix sp. FACHB-123]|uniref:PAS domain S-box protein n=1 Tax=Tolypothrix sp. FACHB-123 TaxID=2692868 RepID=UPI001684470D|nr:PAS domain S-box protein [Tolypothrix sp. FACHB-123]MBD2356129.1 PAS domain S-box protein [Tolypothrix sp. FACHB-123]